MEGNDIHETNIHTTTALVLAIANIITGGACKSLQVKVIASEERARGM